MRLFQKLKAKKITKIEEELKKLRERDQIEDIEKWIKIDEYILKNLKTIKSNPYIIKKMESQLKKTLPKESQYRNIKKKLI